MPFDSGLISPLMVSPDFVRFTSERLNSRYPIDIGKNSLRHESESHMNVFTIDMLHCYDDFILQLDDEIVKLTQDPHVSIGFRCCRNLQHTHGRVFFHCNDHAFARIPAYCCLLETNRVSGNGFEEISPLLTNNPEPLWNFKGLMAYRPWGPKANWAPANEFRFMTITGGGEMSVKAVKAATWVANHPEAGAFISSMEFILPAGEYEIKAETVTVPLVKNP